LEKGKKEGKKERKVMKEGRKEEKQIPPPHTN